MRKIDRRSSDSRVVEPAETGPRLNSIERAQNAVHFEENFQANGLGRGGGFKDEIVSKAHTKTSDKSESSVDKRHDARDSCLPLLPAGEYRVRFKGYSVYTIWKSLKLKLDFLVAEEGPYFGTVVHRHYTVQKVGKRGWKPTGTTGCLLIEWYKCHPDSPRNLRRDRLPMSKWFESEYFVRLETVCRNHQKLVLPDQLRYSVIREISGRA